jgi:hypothetical protein
LFHNKPTVEPLQQSSVPSVVTRIMLVTIEDVLNCYTQTTK